MVLHIKLTWVEIKIQQNWPPPPNPPPNPPPPPKLWKDEKLQWKKRKEQYWYHEIKTTKDKRFHVFKPEFYKFASWAYWVLAASCAPLFCSYHILTQSVINHQTDRPIWNLHYLFHENVLTCYKTANMGHQMATYAANSVP